jgi:hypothetical protein
VSTYPQAACHHVGGPTGVGGEETPFATFAPTTRTTAAKANAKPIRNRRRETAPSSRQNGQPYGAGPHDGSGDQPGGGDQPAGGVGQPGGTLNRMPMNLNSPHESLLRW